MRAVLASLMVAVIAVALAACEDSDGSDTSRGVSPEEPAMLLDADAFAARIARPDALVINVHVPYEGEIDGTDAVIPFDRIVGNEHLPADKGAEIVLYCRSGRMSQIAADALAQEGYTNLYDLEGGMLAWEAAGRWLVHRRPAGSSQ